MNPYVYEKALQWIPQGSRVLDLGCGDGSFLERLKREKDVTGEGVERDTEMLIKSIERGLEVHQGDLLEGLDQHPDQSFDFILLLGTFQELMSPGSVLRESFRVGRRVLLAHLNFAYWRYRRDLAISGITPITDQAGLAWYHSPNTKFFSIKDFIYYCQKRGIQRSRGGFFNSRGPVSLLPNLRAGDALWMLELEDWKE